MFTWYKDLVDRVFSSLFEKSGETVSFLDYLSVVGASLLFMLVIAIIIAVLFGSAAGPVFTYRKLMSGVKKKMQAFNDDSDLTQFNFIKKKVRNRKVLYWSLFGFVYIPVIIPTNLYVLSLITSVFS